MKTIIAKSETGMIVCWIIQNKNDETKALIDILEGGYELVEIKWGEFKNEKHDC